MSQQPSNQGEGLAASSQEGGSTASEQRDQNAPGATLNEKMSLIFRNQVNLRDALLDLCNQQSKCDSDIKNLLRQVLAQFKELREQDEKLAEQDEKLAKQDEKLAKQAQLIHWLQTCMQTIVAGTAIQLPGQPPSAAMPAGLGSPGVASVSAGLGGSGMPFMMPGLVDPRALPLPAMRPNMWQVQQRANGLQGSRQPAGAVTSQDVYLQALSMFNRDPGSKRKATPQVPGAGAAAVGGGTSDGGGDQPPAEKASRFGS